MSRKLFVPIVSIAILVLPTTFSPIKSFEFSGSAMAKNISDGAAKGQASEGTARRPKGGANGSFRMKKVPAKSTM